MLEAASRAWLTKAEDNLTDENEDDDADMRLSFWRILRHKRPKRANTAQKTMAETVKRNIHTHSSHQHFSSQANPSWHIWQMSHRSSIPGSKHKLGHCRAVRFLKRHHELKSQYAKTLALLEINPHHPSLRLHALSGRLHGLHSVSINLSYRITLELLIQDQQIIPVNVGDPDGV